MSGGGDVTGSTSVVKTSSLDDTVYVLEEGVAVTAANLSMPGKKRLTVPKSRPLLRGLTNPAKRN